MLTTFRLFYFYSDFLYQSKSYSQSLSSVGVGGTRKKKRKSKRKRKRKRKKEEREREGKGKQTRLVLHVLCPSHPCFSLAPFPTIDFLPSGCEWVKWSEWSDSKKVFWFSWNLDINILYIMYRPKKKRLTPMARTQYRRIGVMSITRLEQSEKRNPKLLRIFKQIKYWWGKDCNFVIKMDCRILSKPQNLTQNHHW